MAVHLNVCDSGMSGARLLNSAALVKCARRLIIGRRTATPAKALAAAYNKKKKTKKKDTEFFFCIFMKELLIKRKPQESLQQKNGRFAVQAYALRLKDRNLGLHDFYL